MKKILILTTAAIFTLAFVACDFFGNDKKDDENESVRTTLTIKNESAIEIVDVMWNNVAFTAGTGSIRPGTSVTKIVQPGSGPLFFKQKGSPVAVRTTTRYVVDDSKQVIATLVNDDPIRETNGIASGTLINFFSKPWIVVKQGTTAVNLYGEYDFGGVLIDAQKDITFTIENIGGGNLTLDSTSTNRVTLGENEEGFFSVTQQPLAPLVQPGSTITFTIRFNPTSASSDIFASVHIKINAINAEEFIFRVKGDVINTFTVNFDSNGGSGIKPPVQADVVSGILLPGGDGLSRSGYAFVCWNTKADGTGTDYNAGSTFTPTDNITLYAKWNLINNVPGANLAAKLSWLQSNAQSGVSYTVEVNANESISPQTLSYLGKNNISITLRGMGAVRTISLSSNGSMFTVASGVTLILDNNITLQGRDGNTISLVYLQQGAALTMNSGSTITGNKISSTLRTTEGGGVYVDGGTFNMQGGTVSNNYAAAGGGVAVASGIFNKTNGTIYGSDGGSLSNTTNRGIGNAARVNGLNRNSTAGPAVNLYSNSITGVHTGGWETAAPRSL